MTILASRGSSLQRNGARMSAVPQQRRTHYQVLGVQRSASNAEIRQAYRQLAYLLHPDRQSGANPAEMSLAERRMREVNVAWTTLSDTRRRSDYDRTIADSAPTSAPTSQPTSGSPPTPAADRSADDGRVEWWDSDDPDAAFARLRASQSAEVDAEEGDLSAAGFWFLRRGPILVMLVIGLVIFIGTAYAGRGASRSTTSRVAPAVVANSDCVKLMSDHMAYTVACDGGYDATIVRDEPNALACRSDGLDYAVVASRSVCIRAR